MEERTCLINPHTAGNIELHNKHHASPCLQGAHNVCVCVGVSCTLTKKIPKNIPQRSKTSHREMSQVRAVREGLPKEVMLELRNVWWVGVMSIKRKGRWFRNLRKCKCKEAPVFTCDQWTQGLEAWGWHLESQGSGGWRGLQRQVRATAINSWQID